MTHALIIGGGIAGPVAALALAKAGMTSTIYEAYPGTADDVGAFMTVMNNGLDALSVVDARKAVENAAFPAHRIEFFSGTGKRLGEVPIGGDPHTLKRADLYRVLHDVAADRGIPTEHGKRLVDAVSVDDVVTARFDDGTQAAGDLLIGADGIHSTTRSLIDANAPAPIYVGKNTLCGYASHAPVAAPPGTYRMTYGKRLFFAYTTSPDGETWWFTNVPGPELSKEDLAAIPWHDRLPPYFSRDHTPAADIVAASETIKASNAYHIPSTPTWHADTMLVIGDAAHVSAPNAGHGASMAIEDAVVLAKCLRDLDSVPAAFAAYESLRRPRVERVVATSARMGNTATPGPFKRILRDIVLPRKLKNGPRNTADWLTKYHINWDEPVTQSESAGT